MLGSSHRARDGQSSTIGLSPRFTILRLQVSISMSISSDVGCQNRRVTITEDSITLYGSFASWGGMLTTDVRLFSTDSSPIRYHVISTNLDRRHGNLWSDCSSILPQAGVAGTSVFLVVVGQSLPWSADRDPLGCTLQLLLQLWLQWGSQGMGSVSLDELTSTHLEGAMAAKTSPSIKKASGSITCQSSTTHSTRQSG